MFIRSHKCFLFTKLRLLKNLKKTLERDSLSSDSQLLKKGNVKPVKHTPPNFSGSIPQAPTICWMYKAWYLAYKYNASITYNLEIPISAGLHVALKQLLLVTT